jgi:hypothetical protein
MHAPLPTHPLTGALALGWRKARPGEDDELHPIWPILGAADDEDDEGQDDDGDGQGDDSGDGDDGQDDSGDGEGGRFDHAIGAILDPAQYAVWQIPIVSGRKR